MSLYQTINKKCKLHFINSAAGCFEFLLWVAEQFADRVFARVWLWVCVSMFSYYKQCYYTIAGKKSNCRRIWITRTSSFCSCSKKYQQRQDETWKKAEEKTTRKQKQERTTTTATTKQVRKLQIKHRQPIFILCLGKRFSCFRPSLYNLCIDIMCVYNV